MSRILSSAYKKSIYDVGLPREQEAIIWDFYVTKSVAASAAQKRMISDYGWTKIPFDKMKKLAGLDENNVKILLANSINKTLKDYDLDTVVGKEEKKIEIDIPKIICLSSYTIADEEQPKAKCGEAESVLTHIRNAFAHGNTYFFDNGNIMLEDKNRNIVTARIIIRQQTLLDWIFLIDKEQKYYVPVVVK